MSYFIGSGLRQIVVEPDQPVVVIAADKESAEKLQQFLRTSNNVDGDRFAAIFPESVNMPAGERLPDA
jgi:hypothetical protein